MPTLATTKTMLGLQYIEATPIASPVISNSVCQDVEAVSSLAFDCYLVSGVTNLSTRVLLKLLVADGIWIALLVRCVTSYLHLDCRC